MGVVRGVSSGHHNKTMVKAWQRSVRGDRGYADTSVVLGLDEFLNFIGHLLTQPPYTGSRN